MSRNTADVTSDTGARPNIALVVLDTLRKDAFDRHFDWLPGRRFERAYSTANWTVPAHGSLFTGQYPSETGVHAKHLTLDCEFPVLAELLGANGYTTRGFSANTNITSHFDFDRGFDDLRTPNAPDVDDHLFDWHTFSRETAADGLRKYARGVYECFVDDVETIASLVEGIRIKTETPIEYGGAIEALEMVKSIQFDRPEFLFVNLMEAHEPYVAPVEYMSGPEPGLTEAVGDLDLASRDADRVKAAYDDCARYLSDVYQTLFDELSAHFDYVITLSDHGELLGEHDAWGHEHGVYPELTHVPLCLSGQGLSGQCSRPVTLLDVHRTVLDLADIESTARGQSLVGDVDARPHLTEYHGLTSWSERRLHERHPELVSAYDETLRGYVGPGEYYGHETPDGFESVGDTTVESPQQELQCLVDDLDTRQVSLDNDVPEEIREQLRNLGYA